MSVPVLPIAHASAAVRAAHRAEGRRQAAVYRRRRIVRRIDGVLELVERAALAGETTTPAAALELLDELAPDIPAPATVRDAHRALFRLQRRYMRTYFEAGERPDQDEPDDQEVAVTLTVVEAAG